MQQTYDYIIIASASFEKLIMYQLIQDLGVKADKIILGRVFKLPYFNLSRYIGVKEQNVTIVAESCYGTILCNRLGFSFRTTFVNLRISPIDYLKLLKDPLKYLKGTVEIYKEKEKVRDDRISWGLLMSQYFA